MSEFDGEGEEEEWQFVCYFCKDYDDHEHCIGVPCECPCPLPDERERQRLREQALAKLSINEQRALGF